MLKKKKKKKVFGFGGHPKGDSNVRHCFALNANENDVSNLLNIYICDSEKSF